MDKKPLCIRTFAGAMQKRMNVDVFVQNSDTERGEIKDLRKDINIYPLLLQSLAHGLSDTDIENLPDIDKTLISRIKGGKYDAPKEYIALTKRSNIIQSVGEYFAQTLTSTAYITKESLRIAVDAIADIIENDTALGKATQARLKKLKTTKNEADYLAEVWVIAVRNNKDCLATQKSKEPAGEKENTTQPQNTPSVLKASITPLLKEITSFYDYWEEATSKISAIKHPIASAADAEYFDTWELDSVRESFCERINAILAQSGKMQEKDSLTQSFFDTLSTLYTDSAYSENDEVYDTDELFEELALDLEFEGDDENELSDYEINRWNAKFGIYKRATELIKNHIDEFKNNLDISDLAGSFGAYMMKLKSTYSKQRTFINAEDERDFYSFYVPNDIRRKIPERNEWISVGDPNVESIISVSDCVILTGTGGLGKSMMMLHLLLDAIENYEKLRLLPVFIRLMELTAGTHSFEDFIFNEMKSMAGDVSIEQFTDLLKDGSCLLLFDGWDEIGATQVEQFESELRVFVRKYADCKYILSTRPTKSFSSYQRFIELRIQPLDLVQAELLIRKAKFRTDMPKIAESFISTLKDGLYISHQEFAGNPLLLSIMLMIYGRTSKIPTQTYMFYKEAFDALTERHDSNKGYSRKLRSELTKEQFELYLAEICFCSYKEEKFELTENEIENYYSALRTVVNKPSFLHFLFDIRSNLCLMYFDGGTGRFIHRSFQEYFAMVFLAKSFIKVSTGKKQEWSEFLIGFFERRGDYENRMLDMLYEMTPEKVEEYVFVPFLEEIFDKGSLSEPDIERRFFDKLFPRLRFWYEYNEEKNYDSEADEYIDESHYDFCLDTGGSHSKVMDFIIRMILNLDLDVEGEADPWPYEYEYIVEQVPLVIGEFQRTQDEENGVFKVYKDETTEYQPPFKPSDVIFYSDFVMSSGNHWSTDGYYFNVGDIRNKAEKYPILFSWIESEHFPYKIKSKTLIIEVQKYLDNLKRKQEKTDNSYFGLLSLPNDGR